MKVERSIRRSSRADAKQQPEEIATMKSHLAGAYRGTDAIKASALPQGRLDIARQ